MHKQSKIYIAGHSGLVGSAIVRMLQQHGYSNLLYKTHAELDLLHQSDVNTFFDTERPDYVFLAAAKVGGILYNNNNQADFLYENLMISANVIHAAMENKVKKLLYLGSSCIYPRESPQPIKESSLLTGNLEPTNEGYALAKIAGLKLCEKYRSQYGMNFISTMPTNLYGEGDNFHPTNSHVIPGMIRRFHEAKIANNQEVAIWGTGTPMREFLYIDDLANALLVLMLKYEDPTTINIGSGEDCTLYELALMIKDVVGFKGQITFDATKPDGMMRKVLDVSRIKSLGWQPTVSLKDGLIKTYQWALKSNRL